MNELLVGSLVVVAVLALAAVIAVALAMTMFGRRQAQRNVMPQSKPEEAVPGAVVQTPAAAAEAPAPAAPAAPEAPAEPAVTKLPPILVDTSVIIDGRIADIAAAGFVPGRLLVPRFVLAELQNIADSDDAMRRGRGRRGLDVLNNLRDLPDIEIEIIEDDVSGIREVDAKLVALAQKFSCNVLTTDYNLNRVAQIQGVRVLNVNELSNAIRPVVLPGEELVVRVVQPGKERNQGVGYLADGTMIVVENGDKLIGQEVATEVTRVFQTVAGKMIFAVPRPGSNGKPGAQLNGKSGSAPNARPSTPPAGKPNPPAAPAPKPAAAAILATPIATSPTNQPATDPRTANNGRAESHKDRQARNRKHSNGGSNSGNGNGSNNANGTNNGNGSANGGNSSHDNSNSGNHSSKPGRPGRIGDIENRLIAAANEAADQNHNSINQDPAKPTSPTT